MVLFDSAPFIDVRAFNKATEKYVPFPTSSDAMLAYLQLFHDVPCRIMDLVISIVTHPDFSSKLVTLKESADVIRITEEDRLRDRMAVVHRRSLNVSGNMEQNNLPQFVLYEVLDIIKASREESINKMFRKSYMDGSDFNGEFEENHTLSNMALVHRSWTSPTQKALGQLIFISKAINDLDVRSSLGSNNIFGPWTTVAAVALLPRAVTEFGECDHFSEADVDRGHIEYRDLEHFENLHRLLLTFTNLKKVYFRSYDALLTSWSTSTVEAIIRQNARLTELTLESMISNSDELYKTFNLDFLVKDFSQNLRKLYIKGGTFSEEFRRTAIQTATLPHLCSLTMGGTLHALETDSATLKSFFHILSAQSNPNFVSLSFDQIDHAVLDDIVNTFTPRQCANICQHLRNSSIYFAGNNEIRWIDWLATHSPNLKDLRLHVYGRTMIPPPLPATTENFEVTFYNYKAIKNLLNCKDQLLLLIRSSGCSALKAVTLAVPEYSFRIQRNKEEQKSKTLLDQFVDEMSGICAETGIKFMFKCYD